MAILTLTGPSGAGKTTIARRLLRHRHDMRLIVSLTTRKARTGDIEGEYRYGVSPAEFARLSREGAFLWSVSAHGNTYGTLRASVDDALRSPGWSLMILIPDAVRKLVAASDGRGVVRPFFIMAPGEDALAARMRKRGDDEGSIASRMADCRTWEFQARDSGLGYTFVPNIEPVHGVDRAVTYILGELSR